MKNKSGQTQRMSLIESLIGIVVGYVLTVVGQFYLFPLFGIALPLIDTLLISLIIVLIAFMKNYGVRRFFNYINMRQQ